MRVIRHAIDRNKFLTLACDDSGDVFLQLFAAGRTDNAGASRNGKHHVEINLRVGIRHFLHTAPNGACRWLLVATTNMSRLRRSDASLAQNVFTLRFLRKDKEQPCARRGRWSL